MLQHVVTSTETLACNVSAMLQRVATLWLKLLRVPVLNVTKAANSKPLTLTCHGFHV